MLQADTEIVTSASPEECITYTLFPAVFLVKLKKFLTKNVFYLWLLKFCIYIKLFTYSPDICLVIS